jgi:probable phosphomutase (TIGR03848 family)
MTHLYLIRHGINDLQESGILAGWMPGVHLSQKGQAQAQALARRLTSFKIEAVYASPLERTLETAQIIAAPHGLPVVVRESLGEVRFGRWDGQPMERLQRRRLWRAAQVTPSTSRYPGGESPREMQARAVAELEGLRARHPQQTIIVVSHADVIKAAVAFYIGLPLDLFQRLAVSAASLTMLELGGPMPRLGCLNDTSHLQAIEGGARK